MREIRLNKITNLAKGILSKAYREACISKIKGIKPVHFIMACVKDKNDKIGKVLRDRFGITYKDLRQINLKEFYQRRECGDEVFKILSGLTSDVRTGRKKRLKATDILIKILQLKQVHEVLGKVLTDRCIDEISKIELTEEEKTGNPMVFAKEIRARKFHAIIEKENNKYKVYLKNKPEVFVTGDTVRKTIEALKAKIGK